MPPLKLEGIYSAFSVSQLVNTCSLVIVPIVTLSITPCYRDFEAEVSYIPVEDHHSILSTRTKCYSRCNKCMDYDNPLETPSAINEKGASVMAAYSNVDSEL